MKSYIIKLSDFSNSVQWAEHAYNSAKKHNWDIEYFEGINGLNYSLDNFGFKPAPIKKAERQFTKKGVVGCFLSHYLLWQKAIDLNQPICVLEHDVTIHQPFPNLTVTNYDVIRLAINKPAKPISRLNIGNWWAGAMAYIVTPLGATKIINFAKTKGALPADVALSANIVNTLLYEPLNTIVTFKHAKHNGGFSFTQHL